MEELNKVCALMLAEVLVIHNCRNQTSGTYMIMTKMNESSSFALSHIVYECNIDTAEELSFRV